MTSKCITSFSNFISSCIKRPNLMKYYFTLSVLKYRGVNCNKFFRLRQRFFKSRHPVLLLWTVPFLSSSPGIDISKEPGPKLVDQKKSVIQEADKLFEANKYQEASTLLLPYKESKDVEVLWRLSRALYNHAQFSVASEADKQRLIHEAYDVISEALDLDDAHWAVHKWMGVLLDAHSAYGGIKARVMQLKRVKSHMLTAVELNPSDANTFYMLGSWCYQIADMSWFQRKIAATIFAAPPTSSFEEALQFFSKAEEIQPGFYSQNLLMLGKTLLKLENLKEAAHYLRLARDFPRSREEDDLVQEEATEILKNIKL